MLKIANDIIKEFGLEGLPPEEQQAMVEKFSDVVMQAVLARGLTQLTEEQKDQLDAALEKAPENSDIIFDFFVEHLPNFEAIVKQQVDHVRERAKVVRAE
jgi:phosphoglycolate phosphatase-like HAD superfamily hydrolase